MGFKFRKGLSEMGPMHLKISKYVLLIEKFVGTKVLAETR